jgi:hypothetical protein
VGAQFVFADCELWALKVMQGFMMLAVDPANKIVFLITMPLHFELAARPLVLNMADKTIG